MQQNLSSGYDADYNLEKWEGQWYPLTVEQSFNKSGNEMGISMEFGAHVLADNQDPKNGLLLLTTQWVPEAIAVTSGTDPTPLACQGGDCTEARCALACDSGDYRVCTLQCQLCSGHGAGCQNTPDRSGG